jgi:hypothetical protein
MWIKEASQHTDLTWSWKLLASVMTQCRLCSLTTVSGTWFSIRTWYMKTYWPGLERWGRKELQATTSRFALLCDH